MVQQLATNAVWAEIEKALFAVIGMVTTAVMSLAPLSHLAPAPVLPLRARSGH